MPEYERTERMPANPERVYGYVSDTANLPRYVAMLRELEVIGDDRLRVVAEVAGRREEGEAHLKADPVERRIEWQGSRTSGYRGWLVVAPEGPGAALVTIHLSTETRDDADAIQAALIQTLGTIRERVSTESVA